jgi:hypothetical protein
MYIHTYIHIQGNFFTNTSGHLVDEDLSPHACIILARLASQSNDVELGNNLLLIKFVQLFQMFIKIFLQFIFFLCYFFEGRGKICAIVFKCF